MIYNNIGMIGYELKTRLYFNEGIFTDYQHELNINPDNSKEFTLKLSSAFENIEDSKLIGHVKHVFTGFGFKVDKDNLKRDNESYSINIKKENRSRLIEVFKSR